MLTNISLINQKRYSMDESVEYIKNVTSGLTKEIFNLKRSINRINDKQAISVKCYELIDKLNTNKSLRGYIVINNDMRNALFFGVRYSGKYLSIHDLHKNKVKKEYPLSDNDYIKRIDSILSKEMGVSLEGIGVIYLISDGEHTKIGTTTYTPEKRRNELQTGNAKRLSIIGDYKAQRRLSTERMLHELYKEKRVLGEWFRLSHIDISHILNNRLQSSDNQEYNVLTSNHIDVINYLFESARSELFNDNLKLIIRFLRKIDRKYLDLAKNIIGVDISDSALYGYHNGFWVFP